MSTFEARIDAVALEQYLDALGDDADAAVRPAAQAGAQVLYDEVVRNVSRIGKKSGNLSRAVYQVFSKDHSDQGQATYHISWNARKAPHGHLVEYGHIQKFQAYIGSDGKWYTNKHAPLAQPRQIGARPFVRPAMSKFDAAARAAEDVFIERIMWKGFQ